MRATCTPNGAGDVKPEYLTLLHGKDSVSVSGDNDEPGQRYAKRCSELLHGQVKNLRVLGVPEGHKDWTAWQEADGTAVGFKALLEVAAREQRGARIAELAKLSLIDYDLARDQAAGALGIRVATLDSEVAKVRPRPENGYPGGSPVLFEEPSAWPDPVDGAM